MCPGSFDEDDLFLFVNTVNDGLDLLLRFGLIDRTVYLEVRGKWDWQDNHGDVSITYLICQGLTPLALAFLRGICDLRGKWLLVLP